MFSGDRPTTEELLRRSDEATKEREAREKAARIAVVRALAPLRDYEQRNVIESAKKLFATEEAVPGVVQAWLKAQEVGNAAG